MARAEATSQLTMNLLLVSDPLPALPPVPPRKEAVIRSRIPIGGLLACSG